MFLKKKKWCEYIRFDVDSLNIYLEINQAQYLFFIIRRSKQCCWPNSLIIKGYYLPDMESAAICCQFLLDLAFGRCFRLDIEKVNQGSCQKNAQKQNCFWKFQKQQKLKTLKQKMVKNVLFTLDPVHKAFQVQEEQENIVQITRDELDLSKTLNTSLEAQLKSKQQSIFDLDKFKFYYQHPQNQAQKFFSIYLNTFYIN